ncbi:hypothetical protein [Tomitella fengzijianii]|uniref:Uncharacterized protein n=1 Tax=Tomitella fengzijianii TaxID=2597660 RepID=A0A516X4H2_9ACTN|nr:hypothetical protein [Tomitella fengzijianii]QDQ97954.1 hypothetical protein FO059_12320 [Tomitella fengzijianii]
MSLLPQPRHGLPVRVRPMPDDVLGYHPDREQVADTALDIADRIRDTSPQLVSDQVCALAWSRPGLAAQLILTLAVWLPIEDMNGAALAAQARRVATGGGR